MNSGMMWAIMCNSAIILFHELKYLHENQYPLDDPPWLLIPVQPSILSDTWFTVCHDSFDYFLRTQWLLEAAQAPAL